MKYLGNMARTIIKLEDREVNKNNFISLFQYNSQKQKQLDDIAEIKAMLHQLIRSQTGVKDITKTVIKDIINEGEKCKKFSPDDQKKQEFEKIMLRRQEENIKKGIKMGSKLPSNVIFPSQNFAESLLKHPKTPKKQLVYKIKKPFKAN